MFLPVTSHSQFATGKHHMTPSIDEGYWIPIALSAFSVLSYFYAKQD